MALTQRTFNQTTDAGYEYYLGSRGWPLKRGWVANDGRAFLASFYRYSGNWYFGWFESNSTRTSWSSFNLVQSHGVSGGTQYVSALMDPATNNIGLFWVTYFSVYGYVRGALLTKGADAGWTLTSGPTNYFQSAYDLNGNMRWLLAGFDGTRFFLGSAQGYTYSYEIDYFNSSLGGRGNLLATNAGSLTVSQLAYQLDGAAGRSVLLYKYNNEIRAYVLNGTTLGSYTTLWSGSSLVSTTDYFENFAFHSVYLNHANATWVTIARLSDGSVRLKKWTASGGWSSDVIIVASGAGNASTRCCRMYGTNKLLLRVVTGTFHFYDPANDSLTPVSEATTWGSIINPTPPYQDQVFGWSSTGSGGNGVVTATEGEVLLGEQFPSILTVNARASKLISIPLALSARQDKRFQGALPISGSWDGWVGRAAILPVESRKLLYVDGTLPIAAEDLINSVVFDRTVPVQARKTRFFDANLCYQASLPQAWNKDAELASSWVKEAAVTDDWTKDNSIADAWEKD